MTLKGKENRNKPQEATPAQERSERFLKGMAFRRLIHGAEHVDHAWASASNSEHRAALEEFITEYIWGMIWSRGGLPTKTRSLLTIALLIATHQQRDLILHMRSAVLSNDCTIDELREVVLHTAAYCGIPTAVEAFSLTDQLAEELHNRHEMKGSGAMEPVSPNGKSPEQRMEGKG